MAVAHARARCARGDDAARRLARVHPHRGFAPPARRHAAHRDRRWQPGELITAVTLPPPAGRHAHLSQGARPRVATPSRWSRWRPSCSATARAAWRWAAWRHKPWRVESRRCAAAARRARPSTDALLAGAHGRPSDNAFKLPLVERTLAARAGARRREPAHEIRHARRHQPDRPAEGGRPAASTASTARSRPPARRAYAYERHDAAPNAAYGYVVGAGIAKGRIASHGHRAAPGRRPASSPSSRPRTPASWARARTTAPSCWAARSSTTTTRRSRWWWRRASSRRARRRQLVRVELREHRGPLRPGACARDRQPRRPNRRQDGRATSPAHSRRPSAARRDLPRPTKPHAKMEPQASTAAWRGDRLDVWTSNQMIDWA